MSTLLWRLQSMRFLQFRSILLWGAAFWTNSGPGPKCLSWRWNHVTAKGPVTAVISSISLLLRGGPCRQENANSWGGSSIKSSRQGNDCRARPSIYQQITATMREKSTSGRAGEWGSKGAGKEMKEGMMKTGGREKSWNHEMTGRKKQRMDGGGEEKDLTNGSNSK